MKFRKKPVVIDAVQWLSHDRKSMGECISFLQEHGCNQENRITLRSFEIRTLENNKNNWHEATSGDWLIRGVAGEFYFCKPDIFEQTYERMEED